jgi:hypothetical protein
MTLKQAIEQFPVAGLDLLALKGQDDAFARCLSFLDGIEQGNSQNRSHTSYGFKHMVENPSRYVPYSVYAYTGYVYEGTFVLAALVSGFVMRPLGNSIKATFNISERGRQRRLRELANK